MSTDHIIVFSVPGLRPRDVTRETTPTLYGWANRGAFAELAPTFPCLTSPVQATMWTGTPPGRHGVIANGFYWRQRHAVELWVARNDVIAGEQIWDALRTRRPGFTSAVWHAQNIKDAAADFIVTPAPIHEPGGATKLWCYSKPQGLYQELLDALGHFPLQHYWGPLANIESTRWILRAAAWLVDRHAPNLNWIYLPHLDYAAQKFGPESPAARAALAELDQELASLDDRVFQSPIRSNTALLVVGEYALTGVSSAIYPNRVLRAAGLLSVRDEDGHEHLDIERSRAFAVVDHQLAHVYAESPQATAAAGEALRDRSGVAGVFVGDDRAAVGLDHPRSGEVVLIADPDRWFAYYWWLTDDAAPRFARTVDIHRKPGYDPVELFFDPATRSIPLRAELVKGSHGAPSVEPRQRTALICSSPSRLVTPGRTYRDVDIKDIVLGMFDA